MDEPLNSSAPVPDPLFHAPAERLFEALMAQSPDRIYIKDLESRFVTVSRTMFDFFGVRSLDEVKGKTDFDFFTREHAEQAFEDERRLLSSGKPMLAKEEKETWLDGTVTWVSSTKVPLVLGSGEVVGLLGISRDITEQRKAQVALRESESRLRLQNEMMQEDFESARSVQSVMIPGEIPSHDRLKIAVRLNPMVAVGGDVVTFPPDPGRRALFFLGDVAGHGVRAALFTVLIKYLTDKLGEKYTGDPNAFLNELNRNLAGRIPGGFVTGLCGHFEETGETLNLCLSNAGHPEVFWFHAKSGEFRRVRLRGGAVLGLPVSAGSPADCLELGVGDRIYAFTDGVVEARNEGGEFYGVETILEGAEEWMKLDLDGSLDALIADVRRHCAGLEQQDDISILAIEVEA